MIHSRRYALVISLTILGLALIGLALGELYRATSTPSAPVSHSELFVSSFEQEMEQLRTRNAIVAQALERQSAVNDTAAPVDAETLLLDRLQADLSCDPNRPPCLEILKEHLEKIEARLLIDGLKSEDRAGPVLRQILTAAPGLSKMALSLLQEFKDGSHLLQAFQMNELTPDLKAQLIEAGLDPADETLKTSLHERAKNLLEQMLEQGSVAEAYAAIAVIPLFPEIAHTDFDRLGQSLCRFSSVTSEQGFVFESLKLRVRRQAGRWPRLQSWLTACKG